MFAGHLAQGLAVIAVCSSGLFGAYSVMSSPWGATKQRQRVGLLAGMFAASVYMFYDSSNGRFFLPGGPNLLALSPVGVAAFLLLEPYIKDWANLTSSSSPE